MDRIRFFLGSAAVAVAIFAACGGGSGGGSASDAGGGDASGGSSGGSSGAGSSGGDAGRGDGSPGDGGPTCGPCTPPQTCGGGGNPNQCGHPACTSGMWGATSTIDSFTKSTGQTVPMAIAVDSAGGVHVAYGNYTGLLYANRPAGQTAWTIETVKLPEDSGTPDIEDAAIAVDASGVPHIACVDGSGNDLVYATRTSPGSWSVESAFSPINIGASFLVTMDMDPSGAPHVALAFDTTYGDAGDILQAGHLSRPSGGGPWKMESLGPTAAYFSRPFVRVTTTEVHVVFSAVANQLSDAHRPLGGGAWTVDTVSTDFTEGMTSLSIDPTTGDLHSVHQASDGVRDAHRPTAGTTWSDDLIVPKGVCTGQSCTVANAGGLVIDTWGGFDLSYEAYQYYGAGNGYGEELEFAQRPRGTTMWTSTPLVNPPTNSYAGGYNALALDRFNGVHLVYLSNTDLSASVEYSYLCP